MVVWMFRKHIDDSFQLKSMPKFWVINDVLQALVQNRIYTQKLCTTSCSGAF